MRVEIAHVDSDDEQIRVWGVVDLRDAGAAVPRQTKALTPKEVAEAPTWRAHAKWNMGVPVWIDQSTGLPRNGPHPSATAKLLDEQTALVYFVVSRELVNDQSFPLDQYAARKVAQRLANAGFVLQLSAADVQPIVAACRARA